MNDEMYERFLHLLMKTQKSIFGYILSMMPHHSVAEDILQETIMIMWRKFPEYQHGTNFKAWGFKIARLNVMKFHRDSRNRRMKFSTEALENITAAHDSTKNSNDVIALLNDCIGKLNERDKKLIEMRYCDQMKIKQIALILQRPIYGMYKAMAKVHHLLSRCIDKEISR